MADKMEHVLGRQEIESGEPIALPVSKLNEGSFTVHQLL